MTRPGREFHRPKAFSPRLHPVRRTPGPRFGRKDGTDDLGFSIVLVGPKFPSSLSKEEKVPLLTFRCKNFSHISLLSSSGKYRLLKSVAPFYFSVSLSETSYNVMSLIKH